MEILALPVANLEYPWLYIGQMVSCSDGQDKIVKSCNTFAAQVLFIWARLGSKYFSGKVFPLSLIGTSNFYTRCYKEHDSF